MQFRNVVFFDLTAMFGSAIADYLYTLESGMAGSGIAKLKSWGFFTKDYYAYDAGSLLSVKTSAHKEVGFNQWDEQWELGTWGYSSGTISRISSSTQIRNKNLIPVLPSTQYEINTSSDTSGFFIVKISDANAPMKGSSLARVSGSTYKKFTTDADTHWLGFSMAASYGTTYKDDICLHLVWDGERDGEYEPYEEHAYAIDDVELRGIPKLDANNDLYYDGDSYTPDGTVTRKYASRVYTAGDAADGSTMITDGASTVYKLTTPTAEAADPYQETQICDDFGTEEFVDSRAVPMPVGHDALYQANLRAKLEMAPDSPDGDGDYIVRQTDGLNEYVLLEKELPTLPSEDGTYSLKCTVSGGTAVRSWVADA